jgi:HAD superfamily hydrolase (TIGR01459 family)
MKPVIAAGLRALAAEYDVALCDIWGVVHNGHAVFPGAAEALTAFRAGGRIVVLVSNAPRPSSSVVTQLDRLRLPRSAWDAIVTSGDVTHSHIDASRGRRIFHLGPDRDRPLYEGHDVRFAATPDEAEVVVCTGLFDDTVETPDDYRDLLASLFRRGVPMICANPDLVVERGGTMVYCAGAIADAYERLGGAVVWCGKPHPPIYDAALSVAGSLLKRRVETARVLAIGDSIRTDIAGATALGCGALFIAGGIHALEAGHGGGTLDEEAARAFFEGQGVVPDAAMAGLVW